MNYGGALAIGGADLADAGIVRSYTVAFTQRSGSNQLCRLLAREGCGRPSELFQTPIAVRPGEAADWFKRKIEANAAGSVFGTKLAHDHRSRLDEILRAALPGYRRLDDVMPNHRWIWLDRRDKVAQAVSLHVAVATGCWAREVDTVDTACRYDFLSILSRLMNLAANHVAWTVYFETHGIRPYVIHYENFYANLSTEFPRLLAHLGGPGEETPQTPVADLEIQRDRRSQEFYDRFVEDMNRIGEVEFSAELGRPFCRWNTFFSQMGWKAHQSDWWRNIWRLGRKVMPRDDDSLRWVPRRLSLGGGAVEKTSG